MKHTPNKQSKHTTLSKILFWLFAFCAVAWPVYFLGFHAFQPHGYINPYPLVDISRSFVAQEHFLSTIEPLRQDMMESVNTYQQEGYTVGVYFEYLNTGASVSINEDTRFWPASLAKMPTALAVMKKVENGEWKLSNELVLTYEDRNDAFGDLYKQPVGTRLTIEELLRELLVNSDDTAHRIFLRNLSGEDFENMLTALGMTELYNENYQITPKEYSRIFRSLYTASYLNRESSSFLLDILASTPFTEYLQSGIPSDGSIVFSHKIGINTDTDTVLDSGIFYVPDRPYLFTIMIQSPVGDGEDRALEIMKELSALAYDYVTNY